MTRPIPLIENENTFSPYYFYNNFIKRVANFYSSDYNGDVIEFTLTLDSDIESLAKKFFFDPIAIPLLLSLSQQLKKYHNNSPINLHLTNTGSTNSLLEFLHRADFFYLVGDNKNPVFPIGRKIFNFNKKYLGSFQEKSIRPENKVRCYTLNDDDLSHILSGVKTEKDKRDYLVEHFTYRVRVHFGDLLFDKLVDDNLTNQFIEILAELITNGVLHSKSDTFALMFSDDFNTKFSISDNGIGLFNSLSGKENNFYYTKFDVFNLLSQKFTLKVSASIKNSILSIFETLYYSMLKDRKGLFDLMCDVVINCNGYFRMHTDNAQIVVSSRVIDQLDILYCIRNKILDLHNKNTIEILEDQFFRQKITNLAFESKVQFMKLASQIFNRYSEDTKFSSIRLFEVKFRGVHVEVEIPIIP